MNRTDAQRITEEFLRPVYGFALKRCRTAEDAQDLAQEIVTRAFSVLMTRDDVSDPAGFIWTIAHNTLANYYRDMGRFVTGIPLEGVVDTLADETDVAGSILLKEDIRKLRGEIAHLSALQRKIVVSYYFGNRKQGDIARELEIPLGTVKWHLFEAKKELKRGMDMTRPTSELQFNPIRFSGMGISGSAGTKDIKDFFRSSLNQNICYAVRNRAKTVNEIADDLGVSPVFIESEAEYLEKYGFLKKEKDGYIVNFLLAEPTEELLLLKDTMYKKAAALFAPALFDALTESGLLHDPDVLCSQSGEDVTLTASPKADDNFLMWTLFPWIAASAGEEHFVEKIPFDSVATLRPDGAHNIFHASVLPEQLKLPEDYVEMNNWCGPMWNEQDGPVLWQINTQWCSRRLNSFWEYQNDAMRVLSLYKREADEPLSPDEYAWLAEQGYIKTCGDPDGSFKAAWQIVVLGNRDIKDRLLAVGERVQSRVMKELDALRTPYFEAVLASVPVHLRRVKEYELQYTFHSDGWFLLHCLCHLLSCGKLKLPEEHQKKALTTLIFPR